MTVELGFTLPPEITIAEAERTLRALDVDGTYEIGGDDGCIEFFLNGEVIVHEAEDEHVPKMLRIIHDAGSWPDFMNWPEGETYRSHVDACKKKLEELAGDYDALWSWMKQEYREED